MSKNASNASADVSVQVQTKVTVDKNSFKTSLNEAITSAAKSAHKIPLEVNQTNLKSSINKAISAWSKTNHTIPLKATIKMVDSQGKSLTSLKLDVNQTQLLSSVKTALKELQSKPVTVPVQAKLSLTGLQADIKSQVQSALNGTRLTIKTSNGEVLTGIIGNLKQVKTAAKSASEAIATVGEQKGGLASAELAIERVITILNQAKTKVDAFNQSGLGINTSSFTEQIESLNVQINKLKSDLTSSGGSMPFETYKERINEIKTQAQLLATTLKNLGASPVGNIVSADAKGKLSEIISSVSTLDELVKKVNADTSKAGASAKTAWEKFEAVKKVTTSIKAFISSIWSFYMYAQMFSRSVIEIDDAMTQLKIVTQETSSVMEKFSNDVYDIASRTASSITDLIDSTTTYARLGYTIDESSVLAEYTAMLQNVGDIDTETAQNAITAIIKAFDINADDIESVMDKLVTVGNNFPISVSQIAEGMNNASSMLESAGNSFEETVALLTAANTTVQDISKSSTGLRTIAARIRNTKTELDELGEAMTTAEYDELVKALTGQGVSLTDANGEFRSTYAILKDLAAVWDEISANEKAALAETLSGTRQQNVLTSIVGNFQEATGAMTAMSNSEGALSEANDVYLDSMTAKIQQVKNTWVEFTQQILTSELMDGVTTAVNTLLKIANFITKIVKDLGGLRTILGIIIGLGLEKFLNGIATRIDTIKTNLPGLWASVKTGTGVIKGLSSAVSLLSVAFTAASIVVGIIDAIDSARKSSIQSASEYIESTTEQLEQNTEAYQNYLSVMSNTDSTIAEQNTARYELITALNIEYDTLQSLIELYNGDYQQALAAAYYQAQVSETNDAITAFEARKEEITEVINGLAYFLDANRNVYHDTTMTLGEYTAAYTALSEAGYDVQKAGGDLSIAFEFDKNDADSVLEYYHNLVNVKQVLSSAGLSNTDLYADISKAVTDLSYVVDDLDVASSSISESLLDATSDYLKATRDFNLDVKDEYLDFRDEMIKNVEASEEFKTVLKYQGYTAEQLVDIYLACDESCAQYYDTSTLAAKSTTTFSEKLQAMTDAADNAKAAVTELEEALSQDDYNDSFEDAVGYLEKMSELIADQAWGSKDLAAYKEFFGTDDLETLQTYFGDTETGINNFLYTISQLQGTSLSGVATFDSDTGAFWYDVDKVEEFADALGISSAALQTLIDMVHYYSGDWKNVSATDAATWLAEEGAIKKVGDSLYLNRAELEKYADETNLTTEQVDELVQEMQQLAGYENLKIGEGLGLNPEDTGTDYTASIKQLNNFVSQLEEMGGTAQEIASVVAAEFQGITDADYVVEILAQTNLGDYANLGIELARALPEDLTVEYDIETKTFYNSAADVESEMEDLSEDTATPTIDLNDGTFNYKIYKAKSALNEFGSTTSTATIDVQYNNNNRRISGQYEGIASGTDYAKEGLALLGDERSNDGSPRPEMVVGDGYAYLAGTTGPELHELHEGDQVYNYDKTRKLLNHSFTGKVPAFAEGTASKFGGGTVTQYIYNVDTGSDSSSTSSYSSSSSSSSDSGETWFEIQYKAHKHYRAMDQETDEQYFAWLNSAWRQAYAEGILTEQDAYQYEEEVYEARGLAFEEEYEYHQHLVAMSKETDQEYYTWLNNRYQQAYANNEITLDDFYKYQEEVYDKSQDLIDDYFNDIDKKITMLENSGKSDSEMIAWDTKGMQYVEEQIAKLKSQGKDNNSEEIQDLQSQWWDYYNDKKDREEEITNDAKDNFEELISYRMEMIKDELDAEKEAEKDSLNERLDNIKDFYSKQKELLQDQADEEDYLEEQTEKRKAVSDIEMQLTQLEYDNSAWAQKKKLELNQELLEAKKELADFEKDYAREQAEKLLDETQELQEAEIERQLEDLENQTYTEKEIRDRAAKDIQSGNKALYDEMVEYNNESGSGNAEDITEMWNDAYTALKKYKEYYGENYQGTQLTYGTDTRTAVDTSKIDAGINPVVPVIETKPSTSTVVETPVAQTSTPVASTPSEPYVGQVVRLKSNGLLAASSDSNPSLWAADWVYGTNLYVQSTSGYSNAPIAIGTSTDFNDSSSWVGWVNKYQLEGYASGTSDATAGLHSINELGDETIFTSSNGNTYKMLSSGDHVFSAAATDFLYNFANGEPNTLTKFITEALGKIPNIVGNNIINNITQGSIVINGSCDDKTVSEIRREQRASVDYMLKEINRLAKA